MDSNNKNFDHYIKSILKQSNSLADSDLQPKRPPMYDIVLKDVNDTPRDFLVFVISEVFHKSKMAALSAAKKLQKDGSVMFGACTRDAAETKIKEVTEISFDNGYPLKCTLKCKMQKGRQNVIEKS